jgi:MerR family transcriptional regulator, light-induced transcriptional regulator
MSDSHFSIRAVAHRSGLSAHVIRMWEKRYGVVTPERTGTNRRRYSAEQIERLTLLRQITQSGQSISGVANLPVESLKKIASESSPLGAIRARGPAAAATQAALLAECLAAVQALDAPKLETALERAAAALGGQGMLQHIVAPLTQAIGDLWREGTITAAHEHFATAILRTHLGHAARAFAPGGGEPVLIVATPAGQLHDLGALLVGALAANLGWRVIYLGASLPAADIAGAARQQQARAVALSLVYPEDDLRLEGELTRLRELLSPEVGLIVGGRAMPAYRETCRRIGALQTEDLAQMGVRLDDLRRTSPPIRQNA